MTIQDPKVLITCSGLGSRLGEITEYTNKSLVRIGNKPAISKIIDSYPESYSLVVTVGHYSKHVTQFLKIAYPNRSIQIVEVDKFEGPGSSLAYSMLCAKSHLQQPFIFHACDTLTPSHQPQSKNCVWISKSSPNIANYRTVSCTGSSLNFLQEKGCESNDGTYIGKCFIQDYELFWQELTSLYEESGNVDTSLSDCHAINRMLSLGCKFTYFALDEWDDIGNIDSLKKSRESNNENVNVLDKPEESIFFIGNNVIKFFHDENIVKSRVERVKYLNHTAPKIVKSTQNFFAYEKVEGEILSRHKEFNQDMMSRLLDWSYDNLWSNMGSIDMKSSCEEFYLNKTKNRIEKFLHQRRIKDSSSVINGVKVEPVLNLLEQASDKLISNFHCSMFHGDFILENVLLSNEGKFVLLDWRQDFARSYDYGDAYYDLSKMNHNLLVNHDIINDGHYQIESDENGNIYVDILCSKKFIDAQSTLRNFCKSKGFNTEKIDLLTSVIWINMAPLHEKKFGDFLFNIGKYTLQRGLLND